MKKYIPLVAFFLFISSHISSQDHLGKWILYSATFNTWPIENAVGYIDFLSATKYKASFTDGGFWASVSSTYTMNDSILISYIDGINVNLDGFMILINNDDTITININCAQSVYYDYIGPAVGDGQPHISVDGVYLTITHLRGGKLAKLNYVKEQYSATADFTADTTFGVAPFTVQFTDQSLGTINSREWDFGDGTTSSETNPVHIYQDPEEYIVSLTITNDYISNTKVRRPFFNDYYIKVKHSKELIADFSYEISPDNPYILHFTDLSEGPYSQSPIISDWLWDFGDGQTSTLQNPVHEFTSPGEFDIILTVGNDLYSDSYDVKITVVVKEVYFSGATRSTPAISNDGTFYFGSNDGYFNAFNKDGTQKWKYQTEDEIESSPAIGINGTIYFGSNDNHLYALNPDGTLKWKYQTDDDIASSPAIGTDETIYFGCNDDNFYAVNPDGTLKWKFETTAWNLTSSPAIGKDGTIFFGGGNHFYALLPDGNIKWEYDAGRNFDSSPAIDEDGTIYVGCDNGNLFAFNSDGSSKWTFQAFDDINSSPVLGSDKTIYVGSDDNHLYAINPDGTLKWKYQTYYDVDVAPAIGSTGSVYFANGGEKSFYALNSDGTLKWEYQAEKNINSSPIISDEGMVYIVGVSLYAFNTNNTGLSESAWPCFRGFKNHTANLNYGDPEAPVAIFSTDSTRGFFPFEVQFSDSSRGNITSRLWDFGDGTTSTESNPVHIFETEGNYTVKLYVSNDEKSDMESKFEYIIVLDENKVYSDFVMDNDSGPGPLPVQFSDVSIGVAQNWFWDFGDGETSTLQNPSHTFYTPGLNTVLFITSNSYGSDTLQKSVIVDATWKGHSLKSSYAYSGYGSPAVGDNGIMYVGRSNSVFYAIDKKGTIIWEYDTDGGGIDSSPTVVGSGTIYVGCRDGYLYAFNPSGTLRWKYRTWGKLSSSPAITTDGKIIIGSENGNIYSINPDGTLDWKFETGRDVKSSPAIGADGTIYIGSWDKYLYALNSDGTLKWKYNIGYLINSSPAIDDNGNIYIGCTYRYFFAINPDGTLKWRYSTKDNVISSPSIGIDGTIYFGCNEGYFYALNPDGTEKWKFETNGGITSSPAIGSDSTIYVGSSDEYIYAFNPDGTIRWQFDTDGPINTSPAISNEGMLYIVSNAKNITAFTLKNKGLSDSAWPCFRRNSMHTGNVDETVSLRSIKVNVGNFQCYPNPFTDQITMHFEFDRMEHVNLEIYNIQGEKVTILISKQLPDGNHKVTWDGTNQYGKKLSPGLYLIKLSYNNNIHSHKILLR